MILLVVNALTKPVAHLVQLPEYGEHSKHPTEQGLQAWVRVSSYDPKGQEPTAGGSKREQGLYAP